MKKFSLVIEELVSDTFVVEAENETKAVEKYKVGEFVLEPGNLTFKQMSICTSEGNSEWFEF